MNARAIYAIVRKDLKVVTQNKGVMLPIIILPLVLFVALPLLVSLLPFLGAAFGFSVNDVGDIQTLISKMPERFRQAMAGYDNTQAMIVYFLVYMMAPFFLIVPLMVSSVIGADSFAGEKERKTMEALLYTPTTDRELYVAKLLSGWIAALAVALIAFALYTVTANAVAWLHLGRVIFPNIMWVVLIAWVAPALPGFGLGVMVLISARAQGFQDANQLGGFVVLPVVLLIFGQASGLMFFSPLLLILLGLFIWLLDGLLVWIGGRTFSRDRLLGA